MLPPWLNGITRHGGHLQEELQPRVGNPAPQGKPRLSSAVAHSGWQVALLRCTCGNLVPPGGKRREYTHSQTTLSPVWPRPLPWGCSPPLADSHHAHLQQSGVFTEPRDVAQEDVAVAPIIEGQEVVVGQLDQHVTHDLSHSLGHGRETPVERTVQVIVGVRHGVQEGVGARVLRGRNPGKACEAGRASGGPGRGEELLLLFARRDATAERQEQFSQRGGTPSSLRVTHGAGSGCLHQSPLHMLRYALAILLSPVPKIRLGNFGSRFPSSEPNYAPLISSRRSTLGV